MKTSIGNNSFLSLEESESPTGKGGAAGVVLNHGKEKPSNMVAEGSFDPNTGFHLSRSAKDSDHGLECMASSHPMSKKEATDFLMDVIVAEKRGGNDEKIHATYRSGGNKTSGDVHHAYAARPAWKYNGIPGSQREIKPKSLPSLAGEDMARRANSAYWKPHPGMYENRSSHGRNQQPYGATYDKDGHCEEPNRPKIVHQRSREKDRTWGRETLYNDGTKTWFPYKHQTSGTYERSFGKYDANRMHKKVFFRMTTKYDKMYDSHQVNPADNELRNKERNQHLHTIRIHQKAIANMLLGQAHWYLQARITQLHDYSIILDQSR